MTDYTNVRHTRLPRAHEAERLAIGCIIAFPDCAPDLFRKLRPLDFIDKAHQAIYGAMLDQHCRGLLVDPPLLASELKTHPEFDGNAGGYMLELGQTVATAAHADYYADQILEASRKRRLAGIAETAIESACNGQASDATLRALMADLDDFRRESAVDKSLFPDLQPVSQFVQQDHRIDYLIPHVIVAGQPGVVSARAKSLKTTVAIDANISMAMGVPFLNHWDVPVPVKCGILSAESGAATIAETIRRIAASKGIDPLDIDNCVVSTKCPRLQERAWLDEIRRIIEDNELRCLTIDPTYLALAGLDQNKLSVVAEALAPLNSIIADTGCSIIMVHHNRKVSENRYGCPTLEEITGSGFSEWARFWLLLNQRHEWDPETGRHWIWLVTGGSAGFGSHKFLEAREGKPTDIGGRVWDARIVSVADGETRERAEAARRREEHQAEQLDANKRKLIDALQRIGHATTKSEIRDHAGMDNKPFNAALASLLTSGDLLPTPVKRSNGQTYPGYELALSA